MSRQSKSPRSIVDQFARNLRAARLRKGLTQEVLAERAGLHRTYVGSAERGERNVTVETIARLAQALDVSASELLSEK